MQSMTIYRYQKVIIMPLTICLIWYNTMEQMKLQLEKLQFIC